MISAAPRARDSVAQNGNSIGSSIFAQFTRVPSKQTTPLRTGLHLKIVLRYFVNRALIVGGRSFDALAAATGKARYRGRHAGILGLVACC